MTETTPVKERPILFSGPMVKAILAGQKTVTRRIVKPQIASQTVSWGCIGGQGFGFMFDGHDTVVKSPYGYKGDQLWVRETFCLLRPDHYQASGPQGTLVTLGDRQVRNGVEYRADTRSQESDDCRRELGYTWRPSIFMPRWASRILLEIVSIRIERLHNITLADLKSEGFAPDLVTSSEHRERDREYLATLIPFKRLWAELNGPNSWEQNPWVWRVEFKRVKTYQEK